MEIKTFEFDDEKTLKKFLRKEEIIIKFISTRGGRTGIFCDVFYETKQDKSHPLHKDIEDSTDKDFQVTISAEDICKDCGHTRNLHNRNGCFVLFGTDGSCECKKFRFVPDKRMGEER